jgi:UDP-glucose 4-epimerase
VRDYIQVSDLARAHLAALDYLRGGGASEIFNCGYGQGFSVLNVIDAVKRASGHDLEVRLSPRRAGDPASVIAAPNKLRAALGWEPQHADLDEIVTQALRWEERLSRMAQQGAA